MSLVKDNKFAVLSVFMCVCMS